MNKFRSGYTMVELVFVVIMLGAVALAGGALYVAIHFIAKFW